MTQVQFVQRIKDSDICIILVLYCLYLNFISKTDSKIQGEFQGNPFCGNVKPTGRKS